MTLSFQSLGLSEAGIQQLEKIGFTEPTTIQVQAIPELLAGRDVVGQSQTGTGKTAAFSLPMLERIDLENRAVQALILTPTRALASQVADAIRDFSGNRRLSVLTIWEVSRSNDKSKACNGALRLSWGHQDESSICSTGVT